MAKNKNSTQQQDEIRGAAPQMSGDTTGGAPGRDAVAERAYQLYLARGGGEGRDMDDWLEAERELSGGRNQEQEPEGGR